MAKTKPRRQRLSDQAAQSAHDVVNHVHKRAAKMEDEFRTAVGSAAGGNRAEGPAIQLSDIEGTVRSVVTFVQENPFAAAAAALGAGVVLTSMYWDRIPAPSGRGGMLKRKQSSKSRARKGVSGKVRTGRAKALA
jgi:hypothetical protein